MISKRLAAVAVAGALAIASGTRAGPAASAGDTPAPFDAVAFDYFVLFNPDSVVAAVDSVAPGKGHAFTNLWRTRQFEYCWLRSITNRYVDFSVITKDALAYTANAMQIRLTTAQRQTLVEAYLHLTPWPDTAAALARLQRAGVHIITVANVSPAMLTSNAEQAGLLPFFDALLSTDANHTYKPDARAYQLGLDRLSLPKDRVVFAASAGWDADGAKAFGYPTVWVNRLHQAPEELGTQPDRVVSDLDGLLAFVLGARSRDRGPARSREYFGGRGD